jgi:hypothetical protein
MPEEIHANGLLLLSFRRGLRCGSGLPGCPREKRSPRSTSGDQYKDWMTAALLCAPIAAFDPPNILNPGKILPMPKGIVGGI